MMSSEINKPGNATNAASRAGTHPPDASGPSSAELHNDSTHDSTVDTDGKNLEAARIAGHSPISPDEITTTNATLVNSVPESRDGMAGFDSRPGGNHLLLALEPGYTVVDKGMAEPQGAFTVDHELESAERVGSRNERGRLHYALNHFRPTRVIELHRVK
jgi:hypothetical protein